LYRAAAAWNSAQIVCLRHRETRQVAGRARLAADPAQRIRAMPRRFS